MISQINHFETLCSIENFRSGVIDQLGNFSRPGPWKHLSQEKVMISAGQASAWPKFAHILGHDEWIDIPEFQRVEDRVKNRVLLDPMIAEETSKIRKKTCFWSGWQRPKSRRRRS